MAWAAEVWNFGDFDGTEVHVPQAVATGQVVTMGRFKHVEGLLPKAHGHWTELSAIVRSRPSIQVRTMLATVAAVCILGALFPDSDLIPFRNELQTSRTVQAATQATRWLFFGCACVFALTLVAWHPILKVIRAGTDSITRWSKKTFWWLACGLAFGVRLPLLLLSPLSGLRSDALWYHNAAIAIAAGQGLQVDGAPTAYRPPGYPILLALTYRLLGPNPEWAWIWGLASTGVILLATYRLADRLYGETIARIATLITALYPALIFYTAQPMSDLVFTAGLMLVLYVVALHPPYRWTQTIAIGVALGLLTLTRSVSIGLILVIPLLWFLKKSDVRKLLLHFSLLMCVFTMSLIPWMARNYRIFGIPTLGTNMGLVLYIGNHTDASGGFDMSVVPPPLVQSSQQLNEAQVDRVYLQAALQFIVAHPIEALSIAPKKILQLYLPEVSAAQLVLQDQPPWIKYTFYGITQIFYIPILMCFALRTLNIVHSTRRPRAIKWIGFIITGYFTVMAMLFFGQDRFRLPFLPWMILETSVVLAGLERFQLNPDHSLRRRSSWHIPAG